MVDFGYVNYAFIEFLVFVWWEIVLIGVWVGIVLVRSGFFFVKMFRS